MRNAEIADAFDELADRLAILDPKPYRWMAYRKAATTFRDLGDSVMVLSREGRLGEIDGVGEAIEQKVATLLETGSFPALDKAREDVPETLLRLTRLPGVGPATARKIYAATDGASFESLMERAASGDLKAGNGITQKVIDALASRHAAIADGELSSGAESSGVPRDKTGAQLPGPWFRRDQALAMLVQLADLVPDDVRDVRPSGAYVRGVEIMRELGVVAEADDPPAAATAVEACLRARGWEVAAEDAPGLARLAGIDSSDAAQLQLVSPAGITVELAIAAPAQVARVEHRLAGPAAWVEREPEPTQASVPYELRDRILAGTLAPKDVPTRLITAADIRGELHAHSDWSDGRATILQMAQAARARGDEFFAVCDHSAPYAMVNGLDPARLQAQADEIRAANEQLQREHEVDGLPLLRVLRGTELEILADGSLGLPDSALEQLDWVIASIHVQQRQAADAILERMRRVIENPLVDAIGHPTSRRLLKRERTALDIEALIELAVEHDCVLEINSNPDRLDLDSEQAALALAAGARLTINTDAHRTSTLALRDHGGAVARRAGTRPEDVVNCLSVDELLASRRRHRS
jgi:DNA polymerase (family 10)